MKLKSSLFVVAAVAGLAASASALTVDIVGSTAGRSAVINKVTALISPTSTAFNGSAASSSNQIIMQGTYASAPITVRFNFTGSAAGVQQVSQQLSTVSFYKATITSSGTLAFSGGNIETSAPEIGYSDVFQSTTAFTVPALNTEESVAVIPFKFFKNKGASASFTNITSQQVRELYGFTGDAPLSLFTGNLADTDTVYATGRDALSGTRITTFAETGTSQTAVNQYQPTLTGGVAGTVSGLGVLGASGFSGGSGVKNVINSTYTGGIIVGYLGASDWTTDTDNTTGRSLSYNGVTYSQAALYSGQYTFWGYLHQFHQGVTGTTLQFNNALRDAISADPGSGLEPIGNMNCSRSADGSPVVPNGGA